METSYIHAEHKIPLIRIYCVYAKYLVIANIVKFPTPILFYTSIT